MSTSPDVNFEELARSTDEFNGAQLKAVCVEAGMIALREGASKLGHEHFLSGIAEGTFLGYSFFYLCFLRVFGNHDADGFEFAVQSKKKNALQYFA